jgi:hypothetical protein
MAAHLVLADDGNVVLDLARDHAGRAARAAGQINGQAPAWAARPMIVGPEILARLGGKPVRAATQERSQRGLTDDWRRFKIGRERQRYPESRLVLRAGKRLAALRLH